MALHKDSAQKNSNQSIIVNGEVGAGKTRTFNEILKYLTMISRRHVTDGKISVSERISTRGDSFDVAQLVVECDAILGIFGNAKTTRNDDSSRFGKFMQVKYNSNGVISGASIETYMLDKTRLFSHSEGEKTFHIFYEVFKEMREKDLKKYFLTDMTEEDFNLTRCSGTFENGDE
eukprot:1136239-Ditylum_brightwellii.AAC.1